MCIWEDMCIIQFPLTVQCPYSSFYKVVYYRKFYYVVIEISVLLVKYFSYFLATVIW